MVEKTISDALVITAKSKAASVRGGLFHHGQYINQECSTVDLYL